MTSGRSACFCELGSSELRHNLWRGSGGQSVREGLHMCLICKVSISPPFFTAKTEALQSSQQCLPKPTCTTPQPHSADSQEKSDGRFQLITPFDRPLGHSRLEQGLLLDRWHGRHGPSPVVNRKPPHGTIEWLPPPPPKRMCTRKPLPETTTIDLVKPTHKHPGHAIQPYFIDCGSISKPLNPTSGQTPFWTTV